MGAAYHDCVLVLEGNGGEGYAQHLDVLDDEVGGLLDLQCEGGVHNVGGGEAEVDVAGGVGVGEAVGGGLEEGDHVVVCLLLVLVHSGEVDLALTQDGENFGGHFAAPG